MYVKEDQISWKVLITPCFAVDNLFWRQQDGSRLYILGKSSSLALLFALREQVQTIASKQDKFAQLLSEIREHLQKFVQDLNQQLPDNTAFTFLSETTPQVSPQTSLSIPELQSFATKLHGTLMGRSLLLEEIEYVSELSQAVLFPAIQWLVLHEITDWQSGIMFRFQKNWLRHKLTFICQRCGTEGTGCGNVLIAPCQSCGQACAYCTVCLQMGRSRCCTPYICTASQSGYQQSRKSMLKWKGQYSTLQANAAYKAFQFVKESKDPRFLIWAVCGAGKTELIFPAVNEVLTQGGKVLLATPRKDVVLELVPRLRQVFPDVSIRAAYGSSKEKWEEGQFIISTTHQVLRFYQAFQLVIVDEVDAFPFHNNHVLYRAVERARKPDGKTIYLSATPPTYLRNQLVGTCLGQKLQSPTHVLIPQRYHGHPLPVPEICKVTRWKQNMSRHFPIHEILAKISESFQAGKQVFIFVPKVSDVQPVLEYFRKQFPTLAHQMEGVHAADDSREVKVQGFRNRTYCLLVTTTILERGVTIPRSDVIVLGADEEVFDEASLVQIAGRVGRSADSPDGKVLFLVQDRTKPPLAAIREIQQMNQLADRLPKTITELPKAAVPLLVKTTQRRRG